MRLGGDAAKHFAMALTTIPEQPDEAFARWVAQSPDLPDWVRKAVENKLIRK